MSMLKTSRVAALVLLLGSGVADSLAAPGVQVPAGFVSLFNGTDLSGWRGRLGGGGTFSPVEEARFTTQERARHQAEWNAERDKHWRVDAAKGEIVSDGQSVHLATERHYADFEFWVEWRFTKAGADSGIYLRSYPQVQLWDPSNPDEQKNGAFRGSAGLWNNVDTNPGKWPLVKADRPIGQWNTLRIKLVGERVWVSLNGQTTVNGQVLDNFIDPGMPLLPSGSIELQTHGAETHFRNLFVREIGAEEAQKILAPFAKP